LVIGIPPSRAGSKRQPSATPDAAQRPGDPRSGTGWAIGCSRPA